MTLLLSDGDTPEHFADTYLRDDLAGRRVMQKAKDPDGGEHIELRTIVPCHITFLDLPRHSQKSREMAQAVTT